MAISPSASASAASKEVVFHCEYAPSGRAKCRVCLNSILEGSLRLAISVPSAEPSLPDPQHENITRQRRIAAEAPQWCHANCFRKSRASTKWWQAHMDPAVRWIGFSELSKADQAAVRGFVAACEKKEEPPHFQIKGESKKTHKAADDGKQHRSKRAKALDTKEKEREESRLQKRKGDPLEAKQKQRRSRPRLGEEQAKKTRPQSLAQDDESGAKKHIGGKRRSSGANVEAESPRKQQRKAVESKRRKTNDDVKKRADETEVVHPAPEHADEESIGLSLTPRQQQRIEEQLQKARAETATTLRSLLRMNNQKISGHKDELAHRVAECRVLGAIPKCPQCHTGFLRFDGNKMEYNCPGFVDEDGEYERCSFKSTDLKRLPWKE